MTKLLINEAPLQVLPTLAKYIGLNEAIFIQQLHYWLSNKKVGRVVDGKKWVFNSITEWQGDNFPFWSESAIKRVIKNLESDKLVLSRKDLNKLLQDNTKWYTINYEALEELKGPIHRVFTKSQKRKSARAGRGAKVQNELGQKYTLYRSQEQSVPTITRDYTETTTKKNTSKTKKVLQPEALTEQPPTDSQLNQHNPFLEYIKGASLNQLRVMLFQTINYLSGSNKWDISEDFSQLSFYSISAIDDLPECIIINVTPAGLSELRKYLNNICSVVCNTENIKPGHLLVVINNQSKQCGHLLSTGKECLICEAALTTTPPYHSFKQIEGNAEVKVCQACNLVWEVGTLAQMIDDKYSLNDKEAVDDARIYCSLEPGQLYQPTLPTPAESVQEMIEEDERFRSYTTGLIPTPPQSALKLSPPNQLKGITKVPLVNSQAQNIPHVRKLLPDFTSTSHFNLDALPSAHKWLPWNNGQYSQCGMCSLIKDGVSLGCYYLVINGELEFFGFKEDLPTCGECLETVARCVAIIAGLVHEFRSATATATKTIAIIGPPSTKTIATQMVAEMMAETRTEPVQGQQNLYPATEAPQRTLTDDPALYTPSSATEAESAPVASSQVVPFDFAGGGGSGENNYNPLKRVALTAEEVEAIANGVKDTGLSKRYPSEVTQAYRDIERNVNGFKKARSLFEGSEAQVIIGYTIATYALVFNRYPVTASEWGANMLAAKEHLQHLDHIQETNPKVTMLELYRKAYKMHTENPLPITNMKSIGYLVIEAKAELLKPQKAQANQGIQKDPLRYYNVAKNIMNFAESEAIEHARRETGLTNWIPSGVIKSE